MSAMSQHRTKHRYIACRNCPLNSDGYCKLKHKEVSNINWCWWWRSFLLLMLVCFIYSLAHIII